MALTYKNSGFAGEMLVVAESPRYRYVVLSGNVGSEKTTGVDMAAVDPETGASTSVCVKSKPRVRKRKMNPALSYSLAFFVLFFLFTVIFSGSTKGQVPDRIESNASFAEKIYLQLDTKTYTLGNIVWFKCVVLNACDHVPSKLSRVLYAELITPEEIIKEKKLIKIEEGIGQGFFFLDKNMKAGLYQIRAYTEWDKNFGSDFFYTEYIHVFSDELKVKEESPVSNLTLIKGQDNKNRLKATFNPVLLDSLQKRKLTVIVSIDDKRDTLELKSDRDDQYILDYEISEDSHFATISLQTRSNKRYTKTIVLNEDILDFQFFPESGEMVHGLQSRVGFKALDANGQGKMIEGNVVDERDSVITTFKSNILGMGSFMLNYADSTRKYYARLKTSEEGKVQMYPLPKTAAKGNILAVERRGENILVAAMSNYLKNDSITLNITCRGMNLYDMKLGLKDGTASVLIPVNKLPEGIISCTLKDRYNQPVAERLYFVERRGSRIGLTLTTDKESYARREETKLDIQVSNSAGEPVNANLSVLVINKDQLGEIQETRQNILSYFLLESELKGKIENPGYYFSSETNRQNDLDALMLTQGWSKYHYSKEYEEIRFSPERNLNITGKVSGIASEKRMKESKLTLMIFGVDYSVYTAFSDSTGKFRFNLEDEYDAGVRAVIQSSKTTGNEKKVNYTIRLDNKLSPPVTFDHEKTVEKLDSVVQVLVEQNVKRSKIEEAFPLDSGVIMIKEVEVKAYKITKEREKIIAWHGIPDEIIDGKELEAQEEDWSYGLYSVLKFRYFDKVDISTSLSGLQWASLRGNDITLVTIDGEPVRIEDYRLLPGFPVSEVSSLEIYDCADGFNKLFSEVTGLIPTGIICGGIIAIYTRGGKGVLSRTPEGITKTNIQVFSAPREFYAPKYDNMKEEEWQRPDLRALIHWAPEIKTSEQGKASLSFYNADNAGDMIVVVEVVSENGEIGYKELNYNVERKQREFKTQAGVGL